MSALTVEPASAPVPGDWVRARGADDSAGIVLVLHGSGYLICPSRTHRGFASHLSQYSGMPAFAIDYQLALEHPFRQLRMTRSPRIVGCSPRDIIRRRFSSLATRPVGTSR
jgi:hypothetical protein